MPHSTIRRGTKPKKWSGRDRLLAMALTAYEDGLCPGCGQPRDRAWNEDMEGHYETHRTMCHACQAKHLYDDAHGAPGPAEHQYVRDIAPEGYAPDPRMAGDA